MQPSEIGQSYDSIARRWLEPHLESNGIRQHEHALKFRPDGGSALDVGSGCSGRFIRLLQSRGYFVEGLDVSAQMIAFAQQRNPDVTFHHADICEWSPPRQYDFITAWDSIWHVPLQHHEAVLQKLCGALSPGGIFIWTTGGLDEPSEKHDSAMGPPVYYSVLGIPKTLEVIADAGCICRHLEYDQYPEKHLTLIAQKT
ncbi:class I SAM-dependent methyltransferase [Luteolibacter soli]|uniref:Class I SAM-dependent methyltransferase n=1 Tax=Luteolibacter soli TaxID=3135280 RepID=A0ABU9AVK6_9BACT